MDGWMDVWMDGGAICGGYTDQSMGTVVTGGGGEGQVGGGQICNRVCCGAQRRWERRKPCYISLVSTRGGGDTGGDNREGGGGNERIVVIIVFSLKDPQR